MKIYLIENLVTKERKRLNCTWDYKVGELLQLIMLDGWWRIIDSFESRIEYVEEHKKIFNEHIGEKITVNYNTTFETTTTNDTITGTIIDSYFDEELTVITEDGWQIINIYNIVEYTFVNEEVAL